MTISVRVETVHKTAMISFKDARLKKHSLHSRQDLEKNAKVQIKKIEENCSTYRKKRRPVRKYGDLVAITKTQFFTFLIVFDCQFKNITNHLQRKKKFKSHFNLWLIFVPHNPYKTSCLRHFTLNIITTSRKTK